MTADGPLDRLRAWRSDEERPLDWLRSWLRSDAGEQLLRGSRLAPCGACGEDVGGSAEDWLEHGRVCGGELIPRSMRVATAEVGEWMSSGRRPGRPPHASPGDVPPRVSVELVFADAERTILLAARDHDGCEALVVSVERSS